MDIACEIRKELQKKVEANIAKMESGELTNYESELIATETYTMNNIIHDITIKIDEYISKLITGDINES